MNSQKDTNEITSFLCTGLEALYFAAVDSGIEMVTAVAGYPTTAVMEKFLKDGKEADINAVWMTNEKVAMEAALGASVDGRRAIVLAKHVGMNVLADPLISSVTHTTGAGVVVFAGDDPGVVGSQNEQDSRWYGQIAEIAVFDPSTPQDAYTSVLKAFEISERTRSPAIVRITNRLEISEGEIERIEPKEEKVVFDKSIWNLTMRGKHQRFHVESYPILVEESENTSLSSADIQGRDIGIISSGFPSAVVNDVLKAHPDISHLSLKMVNPIPFNKIREFAELHEKILVVEETESFIESHLSVLNNVLGKNTGHLPHSQLDAEHIEYALDHIKENRVVKYTGIQTIKSRGPHPICEDCPYMPLYELLGQLDTKVAGDIGCSIRSASEPLRAIETGYSLGSAVSVACGFKEKGIALMGDFALAHSGIVGLINAVHRNFEMVVIVLQNRVAAMTGGQDVPDLTDVVKAVVDDVSVYGIDEGEGRVSRSDRGETGSKRNLCDTYEGRMQKVLSFFPSFLLLIICKKRKVVF